MEQKHINTIRTCLKIMRVFGKVEDRDDIEDALEAFDKAIKMKTLSVTYAGKLPKKPRIKTIEEQMEEWENDPD